MATTLPKQLVLGDFGDAVETVRTHAAAPADGAEAPTLDASEVRRVDGSGLQWLLACLLAGEGGAPAARLEGNAVIDEALRISGAQALLGANET